MVWPAAVPWLPHEINRRTARFLEAYEGLDAALLAFRSCAGVYGKAGFFKFSGGPVELTHSPELESDCVIVGRSIEVDEGVIAIVRAQVSRVTVADIDLQSDDPRRKRHGGVHVASADTHVTDVLQ